MMIIFLWIVLIMLFVVMGFLGFYMISDAIAYRRETDERFSHYSEEVQIEIRGYAVKSKRDAPKENPPFSDAGQEDKS